MNTSLGLKISMWGCLRLTSWWHTTHKADQVGGGQCLQQGRKAWQVLVVREGQLAPPEQFQEQREGIL